MDSSSLENEQYKDSYQCILVCWVLHGVRVSLSWRASHEELSYTKQQRSFWWIVYELAIRCHFYPFYLKFETTDLIDKITLLFNPISFFCQWLSKITINHYTNKWRPLKKMLVNSEWCRDNTRLLQWKSTLIIMWCLQSTSPPYRMGRVRLRNLEVSLA